MQPVIKDKIAYYQPQGFIDGNNAPLILDPLGLEQAVARGAERVVVSLERVVAFNNRGVAHFAQMFASVREKHGLRSALYGYSPKLFEQINHFFSNQPPVDLYENSRVMALFLGRLNTESRVLVFARDTMQAGLMTVRLKELGYAACEVVKYRGEFLQRIEAKQCDVSVDQTVLARSSGGEDRFVQGNTVVYTVNANFDEYAGAFDRRYHNGSLAVGFSRFVFEASALRLITPKGVDFLTTLAVEAAEWGAMIVLAGLKESQVPARLLESLGDAGVELAPDFAQLMAQREVIDTGAGAALRKFKPPTKELITKVGIFVDATVHTLEALCGVRAVRGAVAVAPFTAEAHKPLVCAACGFYGHYTGLMVLAFPHNTLRKACRFLLGDTIEEGQLPQAAADLTAIIMGRIVTVLDEAKTEIATTQPRTFATLPLLEETLRDRRGVMVHIGFGDETFYFFLSR